MIEQTKRSCHRFWQQDMTAELELVGRLKTLTGKLEKICAINDTAHNQNALEVLRQCEQALAPIFSPKEEQGAAVENRIKI